MANTPLEQDARHIVDQCRAKGNEAQQRRNAHITLRELGEVVTNLASAGNALTGWGIDTAPGTKETGNQIVGQIDRYTEMMSWVAASFGLRATDYYETEQVESVRHTF